MAALPFAAIRAWMFDDALPFWASAGLDLAHGGVLEELSLDGAPTDVPFKRVRVTCRQIYVFSHAAVLGWKAGDTIAAACCDYMIAKAWQGPDKGWARRLTREGAVLDPAADLYDTAFALFALAWRYRASGDREALAWAHRTLDFIEHKMRADEGYWQNLARTTPRLQNPHMHLFEAALAAFEASGEHRFLAVADEMADLFRRHFFDGVTLGEQFDADWRRLEAQEARRVEPGHMFEWAWILGLHQRLKGDVDQNTLASMDALVRFAERHGVDPATQAVSNRVRDDGASLGAGSRAWPNTERIKAHLALFELEGRDTRAAIAASVQLLFDRYLNVEPRGLWMDEFDAEGRPTAREAPASILYHLFLAFAEILRLEPKLAQTP